MPDDASAPSKTDGSDQSANDEDIRILLLTQDEGDTRVLTDWLETRYHEVLTDWTSDMSRRRAFDVCLLDPANFEAHRDMLIEYKESQEPLIIPYLLIRKDNSTLLDPEARRYIDEVIVMPTSKRELAWRIESLRQLHDLSTRLQQKNEQLEYLMTAAAHDLRNPLQIAQGYADQLDEDEPGDAIKYALHRMEHLIENLLSLQQTRGELRTSEFKTVELPTLVSESWTIVPTNNAKLTVDMPDETEIRANPGLLRQLIENLVRNSIDHGGDAVKMCFGKLSTGNGLYFSDNGPGIPSEKRQTVFEEGYSTNGGSGMGLMIVMRVVEAHEWDVRIIKSKWGGVRFEITGIEFI